MDEDDHLNCSICLQPLVDRTLIPSCSHEFCFECILVWTGTFLLLHAEHHTHIPTEQSRRCPLCSQSISTYLIHHIRSKHDYQKHYLPPLLQQLTPRPRQRTRQRQWGRRQLQEIDEADQLERAITKRRWIYQHGLYAKVSLPYTHTPLHSLIPLSARRFKSIHTIQTLPNPSSILSQPRSHQPNDHVFTEGTQSLDRP